MISTSFFKVNPRKATVIQRADGEQVLGQYEHNHQKQVSAALVAKITAKMKAEAKKIPFKPSTMIVNSLDVGMMDTPCPSPPKPVNLAKAANYMRLLKKASHIIPS